MLNISCWNSDWATPKSKRGKFFINQFDSDIICLTEGYENLLPKDGYIISSHEDYGYKSKNGRRKVILWSKNEWTDIDKLGSKDIPSGRFISGVTSEIRIIGLCIPLRFAHVSTGRKDRKPWEDHLSFIQNLSFSNEKTIILGDFNQNIPKKNQPEIVFSSIFRIQHAEHLDAKHLLILLHLPLGVLRQKASEISCSRNLFAKKCRPI